MPIPIRRLQVCVLGSAEVRCSAYLLVALAGEACIVFVRRAGTVSEVCLASLQRHPFGQVGFGESWRDGVQT